MNTLRKPVLASIICLLFASFGLALRDMQGEVITANQLTSSISGAKVEAGYFLPPFTAYNENSKRRWPLVNNNRPTTLIFKSDCTCDSILIHQWSDAARMRGDDLSIIVITSPKQLPKIRKENDIPDNLLAIRAVEWVRLGIREGLPIAVHLSKNGLILSTEYS